MGGVASRFGLVLPPGVSPSLRNAAAVMITAELPAFANPGQKIDITVSGRLAARLVPAAPKRWQRWEDIAGAFAGRPDPDCEGDRTLIDQSLSDPWDRRR